jgi:hypothetical protein
MRIIGLSGKMGVGKDYIARNIIQKYLDKIGKRSLIITFADQLKINTSIKHNININEMYNTKNENIRRLLQEEGTLNGRMKYGEMIWINYLDNWINVYNERGIEVFIITDCRFKNEIEYIESKNGIVLRIEASDRNLERINAEKNNKMIENHISEIGLDNYKFTNIIYNDKKSNTEYVENQVLTCLKLL